MRRLDVQDFADGLLAEGHAPSTIEVTVAALRAVCSRAVSRGDLTVNPCDGIELPAVDPLARSGIFGALARRTPSTPSTPDEPEPEDR